MNKKNIEIIKKSPLWKLIKQNNNYRGNIIIDTLNKPINERNTGQFFLMLVFFYKDIKDELLNYYLKEGRLMCEGEGLDTPDVYEFYGSIKMIRFS